jgi:hypothetical protein
MESERIESERIESERIESPGGGRRCPGIGGGGPWPGYGRRCCCM